MLEENVEDFLRDEVKSAGGVCLKLNPRWYKGVPDRLVVVYAQAVFVELKRPSGGVIGKMQEWWRKFLRAQKQQHHYVKNKAEVTALLKELATKQLQS